MAMGKPKKWVTATVNEEIPLGKPGISVVVWDKWSKTRKGRAIISVGGIRWYSYKAKRYYKKTWDELDELLSN